MYILITIHVQLHTICQVYASINSNKVYTDNMRLQTKSDEHINTYPAETESNLAFATNIEPGQSAHPCNLTRLFIDN